MNNPAKDLSPKGIIRAMRGLALAALHRAAPVALPQTAPFLLPAVVSSSRYIGTQQVPDRGKMPLHFARFAPARKPDPPLGPGLLFALIH